MHPRINYVIAVWCGPRRAYQATQEFLRCHLGTLEFYQHNLAQITLVMNESEYHTPDLIEEIRSIDKLQNTPVVVHLRPNEGLSYGAYSYVYGFYREQFDYYLFMEDDYVFTLHDFDQRMLDLFQTVPNCGYLCGYVKGNKNRSNRQATTHGNKYAHISNGLASQEVLAKIWERHKRLPHYVGEEMYSMTGQESFSQAFLDAGYDIADVTRKYRADFYSPNKRRVVSYAKQHKHRLMIPIQK